MALKFDDLSLVFADNYSEVLSIWSEVFQSVINVSYLKITINDFMKHPAINALLMMGVFAHQRYGGKPKIGQSQILDTNRVINMPPWVVTTPPFAAHLEYDFHTGNDIKIVEDSQLTPQEETYILFEKVFQCIKQFSQQHHQPQIKVLGIHLSFLNYSKSKADQEARGALKAYLENYSDFRGRY